VTSQETPDGAASLELVGLRRRFGPVIALDGLTFGVPPGQVFGFLGPNGAGKTTTMRAIFGVVALDAGEVRWHGEPVTEQARRRFGYMPEERGLYPNMPVLDQLEYLGRLHDMTAAAAREAAQQLIKRLGLQGRNPPSWRRCRTATSSGCSSRPRSCTSRNCSCSTSRSPAWTPAAWTT